MKYFLVIFTLLFSSAFSFGQSIDTLRVLVLSPYKVIVADDCLKEYNELEKKILDTRNVMKAQALSEQQANIEEFNELPNYTRKMFINETEFYDYVTIDNYVSMVTRQYISYRLYKPFKIKPRIVLVSKEISSSNIQHYSDIANVGNNFFIINIPKIRFYKEDGELRIETNIELYSKNNNEILLSQTHIGKPQTGLTDYPMCFENWDCTIVNSVYPSLYEILTIIAEKNKAN